MRSSARSSLTRKVLLLGAIGASAAAWGQVGCSSSGTMPGTPEPENAIGTGNAPADGTGSVGMTLTLPGGEQLSSVTWTVTGPNGASTVVQTGTVNVGNSNTISFLVGGIPSGSNYLISLSGTSTDGTVTCSGSASFTITARATTNVSVALQCSSPASDAGSVQVTANTFNCGTVTSIAASPSEVIVGNSVALTASATGPNPGALTYAWSAPTGSFDHPTASSPNFTCSAPGPVTLTVSVGDGAVPEGGACGPTASSTIQVTCDGHVDQAQGLATATKVKHLVVIFGENISFDHYFGTYPNAQNNPGDTTFAATAGTPVPNGLIAPLDPTHGFAPLSGPSLLTMNPNNSSANGAGATNPFRLPASFAQTASMNHNYNPEQLADDNGKMDLFPAKTGHAGPPPGNADAGEPPITETPGLVMAYFDGNTLQTWWNYAQQSALDDNAWTTNFGPSTPGAINVISGQTNGLIPAPGVTPSSSTAVSDGNGGLTAIGDIDPAADVCSSSTQASMGGQNIGTLLNGADITWGWFEGGFDLGVTNTATNTTGCNRSTAETVPFGTTSKDYVPHHQPFQYYASTANPSHARPANTTTAIGTTDAANHQYDTLDFFSALSAGNLPAVVYLKAPAYQDGHPSNSNPIDEQNFVASVVTALQNAQEWSSTAVVLTYDDSDGWYDHQAPPIVNPSSTVADALNGTSLCNSGAQQNGAAPTTPLLGIAPTDGGAPLPAQGRCGYGTRIPLMVISPFAKRNYIDHTLVDQSSVVKFIEDNWLGGQRIQPGGSFDTIAGTLQNMMSGI